MDEQPGELPHAAEQLDHVIDDGSSYLLQPAETPLAVEDIDVPVVPVE